MPYPFGTIKMKERQGMIMKTMQGRPTDHRNISLRELNRDILRGKSGGRVLWQPRILCWYDDRMFSGVGLPAPYTGMKPRELYQALGCSNRIYDYNAAVRRVEDATIRRRTEVLDPLRKKNIIETPVGTVYEIMRSNSSNYGVYNEKWYVEDEDDLRVMIYVEAHSRWEWNQQGYDDTLAYWGENGEGSIYFPRVSVQCLYNELTGVENGVFALYDFPDVCEEYFRVKHENEMDFCRTLVKSPLEWINFGDNVHCGTLPPELFEKYVLPEYQARTEILRAGGKYSFAHWDGDVGAILKYAKETGLNGIEAITPKPQGDVTIEEVKAALGDEVDWIDGIPAILFDERYPVSVLKETAQKLIDLFAGHLILGISDEMSSTGDIERIKIVGEIVDDHNAKIG